MRMVGPIGADFSPLSLGSSGSIRTEVAAYLSILEALPDNTPKKPRNCVGLQARAGYSREAIQGLVVNVLTSPRMNLNLRWRCPPISRSLILGMSLDCTDCFSSCSYHLYLDEAKNLNSLLRGHPLQPNISGTFMQ